MASWGPKGLLYFKLAMVTVVVLIAQVVAHKRIELGRTLLNAATLMVACVVIYSLVLLVRNM